ncbi:MAG: M1 family metallopeptidase [Lutibacter sp.]
MNKNALNFFLIYLSLVSFVFAQNNSKSDYDITHYALHINLDYSKNIQATTSISVKFLKELTQFSLDFDKIDQSGKGMQVTKIYANNDTLLFNQTDKKLNIHLPKIKIDSIYKINIAYHGIPKNGLIISKNKFGERTFFADNWPNRAHYWFPCNDHPNDKATVEFFVTAPNYFQVIANGKLIALSNVSKKINLYHYSTDVPLPTKVMVIGVAPFAVNYLGETHHIPVSTWVFDKNKQDGFNDYKIAKKVLDFFITKMGSFPFSKLANVQSKTMFGGMENAGNIFYFENSVNGKNNQEALFAHEIAHQWFGDSVSETDWPHLWLSEGFATYFTDYYFEQTKGDSIFKNRLKNQRAKILKFYKKEQTPVVNYHPKKLMNLLNANSYEKGAWFLHMLRNKVGDKMFWQGVKSFYNKFKFKNASTDDFRKEMEAVSNLKLDDFFKQWLHQKGQPNIKKEWIYFKNKLRIMISQTQSPLFSFPLDLKLMFKDGSFIIKTVTIENKATPFVFNVKKEVVKVILDPDIKLLFSEDK